MPVTKGFQVVRVFASSLSVELIYSKRLGLLLIKFHLCIGLQDNLSISGSENVQIVLRCNTILYNAKEQNTIRNIFVFCAAKAVLENFQRRTPYVLHLILRAWIFKNIIFQELLNRIQVQSALLFPSMFFGFKIVFQEHFVLHMNQLTGSIKVQEHFSAQNVKKFRIVQTPHKK